MTRKEAERLAESVKSICVKPTSSLTFEGLKIYVVGYGDALETFLEQLRFMIEEEDSDEMP